MFVDITDTYAHTVVSSGSKKINIYRLAGSESQVNVMLYQDNQLTNSLEFSVSYSRMSWFVHLSTPKRTIYKGSRIQIMLEDGSIIELHVRTGAFKYGDLWQSLASIEDSCMQKLSEVYIINIAVINDARNTTSVYVFGDEYNGQYNTRYEGAELWRIVCTRLIGEYNKQKSAAEHSARERQYEAPKLPQHDGRILTRQYNLNTQYGRRMARKQAAYNYEHGSEEYRRDIDNIGCVAWAIILFICGIIFMLIWNVSGPEAAMKWLK